MKTFSGAAHPVDQIKKGIRKSFTAQKDNKYFTELIDNSIDAGASLVNIKYFGDEFIRVNKKALLCFYDNGTIGAPDYRTVFRNYKARKDSSQNIGVNGIGLKNTIYGIANFAVVILKRKGKIEWIVTTDVNELSKISDPDKAISEQYTVYDSWESLSSSDNKKISKVCSTLEKEVGDFLEQEDGFLLAMTDLIPTNICPEGCQDIEKWVSSIINGKLSRGSSKSILPLGSRYPIEKYSDLKIFFNSQPLKRIKPEFIYWDTDGDSQDALKDGYISELIELEIERGIKATAFYKNTPLMAQNKVTHPLTRFFTQKGFTGYRSGCYSFSDKSCKPWITEYGQDYKNRSFVISISYPSAVDFDNHWSPDELKNVHHSKGFDADENFIEKLKEFVSNSRDNFGLNSVTQEELGSITSEEISDMELLIRKIDRGMSVNPSFSGTKIEKDCDTEETEDTEPSSASLSRSLNLKITTSQDLYLHPADFNWISARHRNEVVIYERHPEWKKRNKIQLLLEKYLKHVIQQQNPTMNSYDVDTQYYLQIENLKLA